MASPPRHSTEPLLTSSIDLLLPPLPASSPSSSSSALPSSSPSCFPLRFPHPHALSSLLLRAKWDLFPRVDQQKRDVSKQQSRQQQQNRQQRQRQEQKLQLLRLWLRRLLSGRRRVGSSSDFGYDEASYAKNFDMGREVSIERDAGFRLAAIQEAATAAQHCSSHLQQQAAASCSSSTVA